MQPDPATLEKVARTMTADPTATVSSCRAQPVTSGTSRASVHRIHLTAQTAGGPRALSLFHKTCENVTKDGTVLDADDPQWKREALLYQSGLLGHSPTGLRGPACYAVERPKPTLYALWLEDAGDDWSEKWPTARYRLAARHLGRFSGGYLVAGRVPDDAYLARGQWESYLEYCASCIDLLRRHRHEPAVAAVYSAATADRLEALWENRHRILTQAHAAVPLSLGHGDTSGRNLYAPPDGADSTIAIDWYYAGLCPLGEDPARLLGSSLHWFFRGRMDQAPALAADICAGYLDGLRDAGWEGDVQAVRRVFYAAAATIYGLSYVGFVGQIVRDEAAAYGRRAYGCSGAAVTRHRREMGVFFSGLADHFSCWTD